SVRDCEFMAGSEDLEALVDEGIYAVQTTPLVSRSGALLGMFSTHWRERHELSDRELRSLDVLTRLAADLIERSRTEEKLRESEERLILAQSAANLGVWERDLRTNVITVSGEDRKIYGLVTERTEIPLTESDS